MKDRETKKSILGLFDGDRTGFTDLYAALATQAFFGVDRNGLAVLHFENFNRADIHAFLAAFTLLFVYGRIKSHWEKSPF
jgi:hypothetical protein